MVSSSIFSRNLQLLLDKKEKSRAEFCAETGFPYPTVCRWLNPNSRDKLPTIERLLQIAAYFGTTVPELIDDGYFPVRADARKIPYYDSIRCGYPVNYVDGNFDSYVDCPSGINATFAVRAEGDSMNGLGILDGDTVFIKEQHTFEDGEVMAVCLGDSVVLKKCFHFEDGVRLKSVNLENKYGDQIYSAQQLEDKTARIVGRLVACQRLF